MSDAKLRRRAVFEMLGVIAWGANAAMSAAGLWPVRFIPWWLCVTFAATGFGWLMGTAGARPDLFDESLAAAAPVSTEPPP